MSKYQAILFDLDGTLADSIMDIADAMNRALSHFGFPIHDYVDYKYFVGEGLKNLTITCLPKENRDDETIEKCFQYLMKDYQNNFLNKTRLYDGIEDLLNYLSENKIKLAVLSNKADEITRPICDKLLKNWNFDIIMGATNDFPRKPVPDSAFFIAKKLNLLPENILYLGDTGIDMQTANAAGMFSVGAAWGFRSKEELKVNGAKIIIDYPTQLIDVILD